MAVDETILRAQVERKVREEMETEGERERQRLVRELQDRGQKERERELQRALDAERLLTEELRQQREREIQEERERERKEQEAAWQRNQADMEAKVNFLASFDSADA